MNLNGNTSPELPKRSKPDAILQVPESPSPYKRLQGLNSGIPGSVNMNGNYKHKLPSGNGRDNRAGDKAYKQFDFSVPKSTSGSVDKLKPPSKAASRSVSSLANRFSFKPSESSSVGVSSKPASTVFSRYNTLYTGGVTSSNGHVQRAPDVAVGSGNVNGNGSVFSDTALDGALKRQKNQASSPPKVIYRDTFDQDLLMDIPTTKSSKREVSKPALTIREKFTISRPESHISSKQSDPPARRRLVKGNASATPEVFYSDDEASDEGYDSADDADFDNRMLEFLNNSSEADIVDVASCDIDQAKLLITARPFLNLDQAREVDVAFATAPRRGLRKTVGEKVVDACSTTLRGYEAVDSLIRTCDQLGKDVSASVDKWGVDLLGNDLTTKIEEADSYKDSAINTPSDDEDDGPEITSVKKSYGGYFKEKPKLLASDLELKNYQQVGINWLSLLYKKGLSCILADEMGLGKTCQVISFFAHLEELNIHGPHLVVVPASTLENWLREFRKFFPKLIAEPYYGSMAERQEIREYLSDPANKFDVLVTTYNLASGSRQDSSFLKSLQFNCCVFDEGHMLKNNQSERYIKLMKIKAKFRLILTGTPLQNNLRELVSLLSFILPNIFQEKKEDLAGIFKHKAKASGGDANLLLSEQRIARAKTMMTPFILRRKKDQVLKYLPAKLHAIEYCDMTEQQQVVYDDQVEQSKKAFLAREQGDKSFKATNVLMQLRKAAVHPLLFRNHYSNELLKEMAHNIMQEDRYRDANETFIFEDMEIMNDFELDRLCQQFPTTMAKYRLDPQLCMQSGKVQKLASSLPAMVKNGDRILIFSQFTQMLDVLEKVMTIMGLAFLRLDGSTPVELRQEMLDKFYDEVDIPVFLLSTKAGGFGINLACANVVIIHDLSFNPHDDRQAEDRAHRVGQSREVNVIRLISRGTVEENILSLANAKLELDRSVSDEVEAQKVEEDNALIVADMLLGK